MEKAKKTRLMSTKQNRTDVEIPIKADPEGNRPEPRKTKNGKTAARKNVVPINLEEQIRRRAYELWEESGRESGRETEHWLMAESELLSLYSGQQRESA